jgi:hypothetical protein
MYLIFATIYSIDLADYGKIQRDYIKTNSNVTTLKFKEIFQIEHFSVYKSKPLFYYSFLFFIYLNLFKELLECLLLSKISYFFEFKNWLENLCYFTAILSIYSKSFNWQLITTSICILVTYILFPLKIQKIRFIGLYVVAFFRTLKNSVNCFPLFFFMLTGFVLSFKIQANYGIAIFDGPIEYQFIRSFSMVLGEM